MKTVFLPKMSILLLLVLLLNLRTVQVSAQVNEAAQLALNIEKLAQLKSILTSLKKGYYIVSTGYGTVKSLTQGNFDLHKTFLDGLLAVSPAVKNYWKIPQLIEYQIQLARESKAAIRAFNNPAIFNAGELDYMLGTLGRLTTGGLKNLDELLQVITAGGLRMNDDERLHAIDQLHQDMESRLQFLRQFTGSCSVLVLERRKERSQLSGFQKMYGLQK